MKPIPPRIPSPTDAQILDPDLCAEWIEWLESAQFPPVPFSVLPGETVMDAERYRAGLIQDLRNPGAVHRAMYGVIQAELRGLKRLVAEFERRERRDAA